MGVVGVVMGVVGTVGTVGVVVGPVAVSTKLLGAPVPAPAVKPTPCTAPTASVRFQSNPLITYCEPVRLTIWAFQILSIERL